MPERCTTIAMRGPWRVTLLDTGEQTMTGGRVKRRGPIRRRAVCLTYGDGVSDVNVCG